MAEEANTISIPEGDIHLPTVRDAWNLLTLYGFALAFPADTSGPWVRREEPQAVATIEVSLATRRAIVSFSEDRATFEQVADPAPPGDILEPVLRFFSDDATVAWLNKNQFVQAGSPQEHIGVYVRNVPPYCRAEINYLRNEGDLYCVRVNLCFEQNAGALAAERDGRRLDVEDLQRRLHTANERIRVLENANTEVREATVHSSRGEPRNRLVRSHGEWFAETRELARARLQDEGFLPQEAGTVRRSPGGVEFERWYKQTMAYEQTVDLIHTLEEQGVPMRVGPRCGRTTRFDGITEAREALVAQGWCFDGPPLVNSSRPDDLPIETLVHPDLEAGWQGTLQQGIRTSSVIFRTRQVRDRHMEVPVRGPGGPQDGREPETGTSARRRAIRG